VRGGSAREGKPYVRLEGDSEESQAENEGKEGSAEVKRRSSERSFLGWKVIRVGSEAKDHEPTWESKVRPAEVKHCNTCDDGEEGEEEM
jgi:hypothetical protein